MVLLLSFPKHLLLGTAGAGLGLTAALTPSALPYITFWPNETSLEGLRLLWTFYVTIGQRSDSAMTWGNYWYASTAKGLKFLETLSPLALNHAKGKEGQSWENTNFHLSLCRWQSVVQHCLCQFFIISSNTKQLFAIAVHVCKILCPSQCSNLVKELNFCQFCCCSSGDSRKHTPIWKSME